MSTALGQAADTAVHHYSTWSGANWALALGGYALIAAAAVLSVTYLRSFGLIGPAIATIAACCSFPLHSSVARHIDGSLALVLWSVAPLVIAGIVLALGARHESIGYKIAAALFALAPVTTGLAEVVNRLGSQVPISTGASAGLLAVLALFIIVRSNQRA